MQTQKPLFLFLILMFVSLACMTTAEPFVTYPADTPILSDTTVTVTVSPSPEPSPTGRGGDQCALISADEALHLRQKANERSLVLAFMEHGEVVKLISTTNEDWWKIQRGDLVGYARSKYLEVSECVGQS